MTRPTEQTEHADEPQEPDEATTTGEPEVDSEQPSDPTRIEEPAASGAGA